MFFLAFQNIWFLNCCCIHGDLWSSLSIFLVVFLFIYVDLGSEDPRDETGWFLKFYWFFFIFFFLRVSFRSGFILPSVLLVLDLWTLGFMVVRCNSGRCNAVETKKCDSRHTVCHSSCLGGVWKIRIYSAITCCKCSPALDCHPFPLGKSRNNS